MAVQAVGSMVIQKLTQESILYKKNIDGIELIIRNLTEIQSFLKTDEDDHQSDETFKRWVEQFLVTVYDVEDVIETFGAASTRLRRKCFVMRYSLFVKKMWNSVVLRKNIGRIENEIKKLDHSKHLLVEPSTYESDVHRSSNQKEGRSQPQKIIQSRSVEDVERLAAQLTKTSDKQLRVFSIVGSSGSGKTTLAMTIYRHSNIKEHFERRAWVSMSKCFSGTDVLIIILKQITPLTISWKMTHTNSMDRLYQCLLKKRYLVVMDDVSLNFWNAIKGAFPDTGDGSRVIFTTGNEYSASFAVADPSWRHHIIKLRPQFSDSHISNLKMKIVEKFIGLPVTTMVLEVLLSSKNNVKYEELLQVLELPGWQFDGNKIESSETNASEINSLKIKIASKIEACIYDVLPVHLRPCFLYFGLFPREYKIPVRRLFRLWLAEGFVKQSQEQSGMTPEDLAKNYLEDLVNKNLIQTASPRLDGSFKTCHMPGIIYDIFLPKAVDIGLFYIHGTSDYTSKQSPRQFGIRRLVEHVDIKYYPHNSQLYIKHLRSYISFTYQKRGTRAVEISNFIRRSMGRRGFGFLRVLDLEGVYKPRLPEEVGNLFHLRYLGLRWTFLDNLPSSIGDLPFLQTLDVKHTYISNLPSSIWKMKYLRHLCVNEICLDISVQELCLARRFPTQLQTLWGLFVDKKSPVKKGLDRLINLRKLGLTCHSTSVEELFKWIVRLTSLQYLKLRSKDDLGRTSKIDLKPLSSLEHLAHLYLLGTLPTLLTKNEFPPNLKVLTLSISQLTDDPMATLAELPSLSVLRLLADSFTGKKMVCPAQGFVALRVLKLWMLANLEDWIVEDGAMQNLQELEIRCCSQLKLFPDSLLNMSTMEKLIFTTMPKEFVADVKAKQHDHSIITINNWDFDLKSPIPMK